MLQEYSPIFAMLDIFAHIWVHFVRFGHIENPDTDIFFSIRVFFHGHWRLTGQQGKGGDHLLSHSTNSTRSRTFSIYLQLCMWDNYHIFYRTVYIYQTATPWDLRPYRITIWLIDDVTLVFVCLSDNLVLAFWLQKFETGNRWSQTRIGYHPCITSEPTSQVC